MTVLRRLYPDPMTGKHDWQLETIVDKTGAVAGMAVGFCLTVFYMVGSRFYGLDWLGIKTVSSGIFGIPAGFLTIYVVSRLSAAPGQELQEFIESVRYPRGSVGAAGQDD